MDKVLVNLFVPSIGARYDVYIPTFLTVGEISQLLAEILDRLTNHQYASSGEEFLCSLDKNLLLRQEHTLHDYGVVNGEHLMLC